MIVDYNETWHRHFSEVREYLEVALAPDVRSVEHVGGTAVEGSVCKPIIDIHLAVTDADAMSRVLGVLDRLGYVYEGASAAPGKGPFRRKGPDVPFRDPKRDWFPHSLGASVVGTGEFENRVRFRDHLRSHPADRDAFTELKRSLLSQEGHDIEAYERAKKEFVGAVLARAGTAD